MAKHSAVDEIIGALPPARPLAWHHRVAAQHRATLAEIKAAYVAGKFGSKKATAARTVAQYLNKHEISSVGTQGVLAWLDAP
jgi:hypothetical protein